LRKNHKTDNQGEFPDFNEFTLYMIFKNFHVNKVDRKKKCYDEKIFKSPEINFLNYFLFFSGQKLKIEILARIKYFLSFSGQNLSVPVRMYLSGPYLAIIGKVIYRVNCLNVKYHI